MTKLDKWHNHPLFTDLSSEHLERFSHYANTLQLAAGEYLIREDEPATAIYFIEEGSLSIIKKSPYSNEEYIIGHINAGNMVGEISYLLDQPRIASVKANTACTVLSLAFEHLAELVSIIQQETPHKFGDIMANVAKAQAAYLQRSITIIATAFHEKVNAMQDRIVIGRLLTTILLILNIYIFALPGMNYFVHSIGHQVLFTLSSNLLILALCLVFMRQSGYDRHFFGITLQNWRRSLVDGLSIGLCIIMAGTLFKWLLIHYVPFFANQPLFKPLEDAWFDLVIEPCIYIVVCFIQELMIHSALQAPLQELLVTRYRRLLAIIYAAVMFASFHQHISFMFAVIVFIPGLLWAWMFSRQRSLVGVTVSHFMVGWYAMNVLGIKEVLQI